jgi:hypothetical protein
MYTNEMSFMPFSLATYSLLLALLFWLEDLVSSPVLYLFTNSPRGIYCYVGIFHGIIQRLLVPLRA